MRKKKRQRKSSPRFMRQLAVSSNNTSSRYAQSRGRKVDPSILGAVLSMILSRVTRKGSDR